MIYYFWKVQFSRSQIEKIEKACSLLTEKENNFFYISALSPKTAS